jgi:hypothetical protein
MSGLVEDFRLADCGLREELDLGDVRTEQQQHPDEHQYPHLPVAQERKSRVSMMQPSSTTKHRQAGC